MNSMRLELEEARTKDARLADLDRQLRHEMTQHDLTRGELERVLLENQSLHGDRRSFIEQVRIAEAKERKSLEAELRKLEVDLQRLRSARDALQKSLEERMSRDEVEMRHVQEMRQLAQTRKDRMMTLEADLQRLKMCVAANMGETSLIEFFDEAPDTSPYKVLRERLSQAETRINQFEELMTSLQSEDPTAQLAAQIDQQASVERQLRKEIDDFVRLLGSSNPDLVARLEDQDRQIAELRAKVDYSQKTETRLLNEIETIGKAWAELEEQTSKKVFNLADKEEHIMRLLAEVCVCVCVCLSVDMPIVAVHCCVVC
ncbi:hypothetical protein BC831DRAFT_76260 [Entophlyctis helioformis]|nr:hypothetical protein BC831DRAFT_76260 [Entophlyctis helioformis]